MATQLWFTPVAPNITRGRNDNRLAGGAGTWRAHSLATARGAGSVTRTAATVNGPTAGIEVDMSNMPLEWLSDPLSAAVTISGTITLNLWSSENNMSANAAINAIIERIDKTGAVVSTIAQTARVTELGTTLAAANFTVTPTSTNMLKGERIRIRVYIDDAGTMATGFTGSFAYGATSAGASGDSYVTFTETFSFLTTAPTGTSLYLTDGPGSTDTAVGTREKALSTVRGARSVSAVHVLSSGGYAAPIQLKDVRQHELREAASSVDSNGGAVAWQDPANAKVRDGAVAFADLTGFQSTNYLLVTDFGFVLPAGAKVVGIEVDIRGFVETELTGTLTTNLYLTKNGTAIAGNGVTMNLDGAYGGPASLWSASWTEAEVEASTFGALIVCSESTGGSGSVEVDAVRMTVYYTMDDLIEWWSEPLAPTVAAPFTLADLVHVHLWGYDTYSAAQTALAAELAVMNADGSLSSVYGSAVGTADIDNTETAYTITLAGPDISVSAGQRLRLRVFLDDFEGGMVSTTNGYLRYAGPTASASGDSYLQLTQTITHPPPPLDSPSVLGDSVRHAALWR